MIPLGPISAGLQIIASWLMTVLAPLAIIVCVII